MDCGVRHLLGCEEWVWWSVVECGRVWWSVWWCGVVEWSGVESSEVN